jgi:TPP-dependent 2-oxoacid decarboxylase
MDCKCFLHEQYPAKSRILSYEIERQIHGKTAKYNTIHMYDHQMLLPFFAGKQSVSGTRS